MIDSYGLTLVTAPVCEPVTIAEAKAHCRVEVAADDDYIASLIAAARDKVEREIGRALVTQTWRLSLDCFPCKEIRLPRPPLQSVLSVQYYDTDGALQTLGVSAYEVDADSVPGRICPAFGYSWPATLSRTRAVQITYVAGEGTALAVPEGLKQAIKLLVGHWYENREAVVTGATATPLPLTVESLLTAYWPGEY